MKGMSIAAAVTMVLAALIGLSPLLVALSGSGGSDFEQVGWVYMFVTIPAGALLGLVAVGLSFAVSIIGIGRARNRSTPGMLIAVGATSLMPISIGGILASVSITASTDARLFLPLLFLALGIVGFILGVVTGFIAPARQLTTVA